MESLIVSAKPKVSFYKPDRQEGVFFTMKSMSAQSMNRVGMLFGFLMIGMAMLISGCSSKQGASGRAGSASESEYVRQGTGASATGGIGLGTLERVHFPFDSSTLTDESRTRLQNNARTILGNPRMRVLVEGHTDERGSNEYNIALGERRARASVGYLADLGVPRNRLEMKSWGEEKPLDPRSSEEAWKLNRRAEFIILQK
jgi:peptidoglycan-associated lipoprotein